MLSHRVQGFSKLHLAVQIVLVFFMFWGLFVVMLVIPDKLGTDSWSHYFSYFILAIIALVVSDKYQNLDSPDQTWDRVHGRSLRQTFSMTTVLMFFLVATKDATISRVFLFTLLPFLYATLLLSNKFIPDHLSRYIFEGREQQSLLVGNVETARKLGNWLRRKSNMGLHVAGLLSDDLAEVGDDTVQRLGKLSDLEKVVSDHSIQQIILLEFPGFNDTLNNYVSMCERFGLRFLVLTGFEQKMCRSISYFKDEDLSFLCLREEPLENPVNRVLKRALDVCVAVFVVVFLLPPASLLVWMLQRMQSPGPLFHCQIRSGLQNLHFTLYKFRTMHTNHNEVARQASVNDERVFRAGRWLRKYSIDELPQFLNVLWGDMSVVGPRPHLIEHNEQFARELPNYHTRTFAKPGITGLAQVKGYRGLIGGDNGIGPRIQSDIDYIENWSLDLDCLIILKTFWQVIRPPKTAH